MAYLNFPSEISIQGFKLKNTDFTYTANLVGGGVESEYRNIQQFELDLDFTLTKKQYRLFESFIAKIKGRSNPFYITASGRCDPQEHISGQVTVNGKHNAGSDKIVLNDFVGTFSEGDLITFDNDTKTYLVTNKVYKSGTLEINPSLRKDLNANSGVNYEGVKFLVRMTGDASQYDYYSSNISRVKLKCLEVLNASVVVA